jgi:hypothetical protein
MDINMEQLTILTPQHNSILHRNRSFFMGLNLIISVTVMIALFFEPTPFQDGVPDFLIAVITLVVIFFTFSAVWNMAKSIKFQKAITNEIPDSSLIKIIDAVRKVDGVDLLNKHVEEHGRLTWTSVPPLVAVINEKIKNDHQEKIKEARKLAGHLG